MYLFITDGNFESLIWKSNLTKLEISEYRVIEWKKNNDVFIILIFEYESE